MWCALFCLLWWVCCGVYFVVCGFAFLKRFLLSICGLLCRFGLILRCWGVGFAVCLLLFFGGFDLCGLDPYGVC